ncbi:MAG TPA: hypothetical protein VJ836_05910 [Candidatus Saccharimonadales bacterium]|nr:hypothetical protein [Candidatus Saccharimonadales bacterium]
MGWRRVVKTASSVFAALVLMTCPPIYAQDPISSSPNYYVNEAFFGTGGELNSCGSAYCARMTAGEIAAGNAAATAFRTQAGFNTDRAPSLAFSVAGGSTDLGTLSTATTATTTATFAVKTYLSSGYIVQFASEPPTNNGPNSDQINPLATPTASSAGTEQFGINLVANTIACGAPANFGAAPVQVPDNTFSFGSVATDYNTCGQFKYVKGDTIASSTQSTGETDFTLSFIYNISTLTPNGDYIFNGTLVATPTF